MRLPTTGSCRYTVLRVPMALVPGFVVIAVAALISGCSTPAPSSSARSCAQPASVVLASVKALLSSSAPLNIGVLGDSTGNSSTEWVALWARSLATKRDVSLRLWDPVANQYRAEAARFGKRGPSATVWNGSIPGARSADLIRQLDRLQPEAPNFVLVSIGHNETRGQAREGFGSLVDAVSATWQGRVPVVSVLQNAATAPRADRSAANIADIRAESEARCIPSIDVFTAFSESPDLSVLISKDRYGVHPNERGSLLWADVVSRALGPLGDLAPETPRPYNEREEVTQAPAGE
ncbi:SGNH/GDSL hydrolase family protein [Gordonia sp. McavH-238-E]|uniref:SGNH/GDSL hydrolase family protein n=1 Tax=Gordonia sp. McavH-238-E TaxID=2917736 RepID=UPI0035AB6A8B